jgi:hypothetical protein
MKHKRYTKETIGLFIQSMLNESKANARANWMITLHAGYKHASSKSWRDPSKDNAIKLTKAFIRLMNSYLINGSNMNRYVKGVVAVERSDTGHWHTHMIIQQTVQDEDAFIKRLKKLDALVNDPSYVVVDGIITYTGSKGIGYKNEHGAFMQFQKLDDNHTKIADYHTKSASTLIGVLDARTFNEHFYMFEPEQVTINKREWAEQERYKQQLQGEALND